MRLQAITYNADVSLGQAVNKTNEGTSPSLHLKQLEPQVQYGCQVKALLSDGGYGEDSTLTTFWTKPFCMFAGQYLYSIDMQM